MTDETQAPTTPDLVALVGSRMAHDLISPLGAISNGVELLGLTGQGDLPELQLITESVENANARIKTFRIAFGAAKSSQKVAESEIRSLLPSFAGRKLHVDWQPKGDPARTDVKLAFLALMCLENAMPWGADITVSHDDGAWRVTARAERQKVDEDLWTLLTNPDAATTLEPKLVQFMLFGVEARHQSRAVTVNFSETGIEVVF
ncbi:MAG: histidine phosphotransferase family protein [Maritimibacter sp.]